MHSRVSDLGKSTFGWVTLSNTYCLLLHKKAYMKKNLAERYKLVERMGLRYGYDECGQMPELESFLELRKNEKAYIFYLRVFGPALCGNAMMIDMFAPAKTYVDACTVFTESDEAFGLFMLDDNWEVWFQAALTEFQKEVKDMNLEIEDLTEHDELFSGACDSSVVTETSGSNHTESVDVVGFDGKIYRRTIVRKNVLTQRYSTKGMSQSGFQRLDELEVGVEEDRVNHGNRIYDKIKEMVLNTDILGKQGKVDSGVQMKKLRMK